ncbi:hypothetical protein KA005_06040, partial [bacterium]|nr:hypothetical protein [bacterium]
GLHFAQSYTSCNRAIMQFYYHVSYLIGCKAFGFQRLQISLYAIRAGICVNIDKNKILCYAGCDYIKKGESMRKKRNSHTLEIKQQNLENESQKNY